ncbi:MAG: winged helix-turn-helix domain-containing protein [Acidobacteriota bacterium]|nr:winged helix-turn-helix domain-containing protein [Acidobacteriota bacterium]
MSRENKKLYEFDKFSLDVSERLLSREGERISLSEKAFDTLCALVKRGNHLVGKDDLLTEVWADAIVEENNLDKNISILRQVLGERAGKGKFIETVRGHGFRFVPEVREIVEEEKGSRGEEEKGSRGEGELSEPSAAAGGFADLGFEIADLGFQNEDQKSKTEDRKPNEKPKIEDQIAINDEQQLTDGIRNPKSQIPNPKWLVGLAVLIILGLGTAGFYFWRNSKSPLSDEQIKTVAVLPFKSLVAEKRDEALELGMADTLISKLSGEEITVRPLSAIRRYNSVEQDSLIAGRELNVEAVLDGTIQTSGERIRVSAKLLRTSDGRQLWAEQFDEKFTDIFIVQDSISERVAAALKIRFGNAEKKRPTENVEAYGLYMKGRYHALNLTRAETDKGIAYFQQAIELDPNYALAYVGLAEAYLPIALAGGVPSREVMPKAKAAAQRAVEIDAGIAEAHAVLGLIIFWYDWDWQSAEKEYLRAIELNPNSAEAHFVYAHLLSNTGRHASALAEIKLSRELNPVSLPTNAVEGQILFFAGKSDEALDRLNKTIDLNPNFWLSHLFISGVYTEKGMHAEAVAAIKKSVELSGNSQSEAYHAYALARWEKQAEARAVLGELLKLSTERYVPAYNFAIVYNALGETETALDHLEKAFAEKNVLMVFLKVDPKWNNLRNDPRFIELMRRMNFE